jgi:hypothetical protein
VVVNDNLAQGARAAHDWGLASWLGGSMFGQFALNPAVAKIEDKRERGKVVNAAWNGYNLINPLSLGSVALGWFASRLTETRPDRLGKEERNLAVAKDGLTLAALAAGIASGVRGARLAREAPRRGGPDRAGHEADGRHAARGGQDTAPPGRAGHPQHRLRRRTRRRHRPAGAAQSQPPTPEAGAVPPQLTALEGRPRPVGPPFCRPPGESLPGTGRFRAHGWVLAGWTSGDYLARAGS